MNPHVGSVVHLPDTRCRGARRPSSLVLKACTPNAVALDSSRRTRQGVECVWLIERSRKMAWCHRGPPCCFTADWASNSNRQQTSSLQTPSLFCSPFNPMPTCTLLSLMLPSPTKQLVWAGQPCHEQSPDTVQ